MANGSIPRILMLGAAPETRGEISAVVDAYRASGLFARWPLHYVASDGDGGALEGTRHALKAAREVIGAMASIGRIALHVHAEAYGSFWRHAGFVVTAAAARCPVLLQLHGGDFERFHDDSSAEARRIIRFVLECADGVAVACESQRAWIASIARKARVACVPNPATPPSQPQQDRRENLVLFLGRLTGAKGVFDLLGAVAAVRDAVPDITLVCAGGGDRAAVARVAEKLGIADAVKFTGAVGPSGKRALLESAAVFVLPSYRDALPISLLEAMAAGVPVIASPVGAIPEAIVDGVSGFLVAPGDLGTLSRTLHKVLLDSALAARIGAAARESVRRRYAPEKVLPQLEELYASLAVQPARAAEPLARAIDLKKAA